MCSAMGEALGCRDKTSSSRLPETRSAEEQISQWADGDSIAYVLNKCGLADVCCENTEQKRGEYQKDYMLTKAGHSDSKGMDEESQERKTDYFRPCLTACGVPSIRDSQAPRLGGPCLVSEMNAGLRFKPRWQPGQPWPQASGLIAALLLEFLECIMFQIRTGPFLPCMCWRTLVLAELMISLPLRLLKITALLRYNSHSIQFTHLRYTVQWLSIFTALLHNRHNKLQNIFIISEWNPAPLSCHPSTPIPPSSGNY